MKIMSEAKFLKSGNFVNVDSDCEVSRLGSFVYFRSDNQDAFRIAVEELQTIVGMIETGAI